MYMYGCLEGLHLASFVASGQQPPIHHLCEPIYRTKQLTLGEENEVRIKETSAYGINFKSLKYAVEDTCSLET